jgi:hypothetical protein
VDRLEHLDRLVHFAPLWSFGPGRPASTSPGAEEAPGKKAH